MGGMGLSKIAAFIRTLRPTYDCAMGKIIVEESGGILAGFWTDRTV